MEIETDIYRRFSPDQQRAMGRYRHRVFVQTLGWQLDTPAGEERDQFDRDDTVYILATNERDEVIGIARLLPTTGPYLLSEVFPQLLGGGEIPSSPTIWELSRFAAMDFNAGVQSDADQFFLPTATALLQAAIFAAIARGAEQLVAVAPVKVEELLKVANVRAHRLAPPVLVNGDWLMACVIECASIVLTS